MLYEKQDENMRPLYEEYGLPEWSSLTSDDMVLVMESAATSRSFLKFRLEPDAREEKRAHQLQKLTWSFWLLLLVMIRFSGTDNGSPTLSKSLYDVSSQAHERVLRCLTGCGVAGSWRDGRGHGAAGCVTWGGTRWGAWTLILTSNNVNSLNMKHEGRTNPIYFGGGGLFSRQKRHRSDSSMLERGTTHGNFIRNIHAINKESKWDAFLLRLVVWVTVTLSARTRLDFASDRSYQLTLTQGYAFFPLSLHG